MLRHEHQIPPDDLRWRHHGRRYALRAPPRRRQEGHPRSRSRRGRGLVDPYGGLRRAGAAVADNRAMPQWRASLAGGRMQSVQEQGEPPARCDPPIARHPDLETRSCAEMPIVQEGPPRAASAHDQTDRKARDYAVQMGTSGRGTLIA
jgi:hypothetical protein